MVETSYRLHYQSELVSGEKKHFKWTNFDGAQNSSPAADCIGLPQHWTHTHTHTHTHTLLSKILSKNQNQNLFVHIVAHTMCSPYYQIFTYRTVIAKICFFGRSVHGRSSSIMSFLLAVFVFNAAIFNLAKDSLLYSLI